MKELNTRGVALVFRYLEAISAFERVIMALEQALKDEMAKPEPISDTAMTLSVMITRFSLELDGLKKEKNKLVGTD